MIIKKNSGNERILLALQDGNKSITVKLLAEKTNIAYKNIHRNITKLLENGYLGNHIIQEGRCRNKYIHLTSLGKSYKPNESIEKFTQTSKVFDTSDYDNTDLVKEIQPDTIRLGIGFYRDYARGLGISDYGNLRLPMLKLKIGLKLIEQSNLVDISKILNKYKNGE